MPTSLVNSLSLLGAAFAFAVHSDANASANASLGTVEAAARSHISAHAKPATKATHRSSSHIASSGAQNDSITRAADVGRVQGNASAPVWVVEISDMQCPYCKEWHSETYPKLRDEFIKTGKVRFAYINFPLSGHKNAMPAARAAMCASVQGKFWEMQDVIFDSQEKWEGLADPTSYFEGIAKGIGVNIPSWNACLSSKSIQSVIDADYARAKKQGVRSTPSFLIAGRLVEGAVPIEDMRKMINAAIEKK